MCRRKQIRRTKPSAISRWMELWEFIIWIGLRCCRFLRSITCIATFHSCFASVRFQRREVGRFGQNRWRAPGFWLTGPPLELTGRRVVMAFIDTGISYENPVFRYSDGSSRDSGDLGSDRSERTVAGGFLYGTEYVREQIDRALELEDPHSLVPEKDEIGHGTAVASVAAGSRLEEGSLFTGAAPDCEIVAVKLRPAKQYLRDYYRIADKEPAYSTDDILLAVKYVQQFVIPLYRPIVICLGLGTSFGSHSGVSLFSEYLQRIARSVSQAVVIRGVEMKGNTASHFRGRLTENQQQVELRVGEGVTGFTAELWGSKPSVFRLAVRSPGGGAAAGGGIWSGQHSGIHVCL